MVVVCLGAYIRDVAYRTRNSGPEVKLFFPFVHPFIQQSNVEVPKRREIGFVRICEAFLKWPVSWPCRKGRI